MLLLIPLRLCFVLPNTSFLFSIRWVNKVVLYSTFMLWWTFIHWARHRSRQWIFWLIYPNGEKIISACFHYINQTLIILCTELRVKRIDDIKRAWSTHVHINLKTNISRLELILWSQHYGLYTLWYDHCLHNGKPLHKFMHQCLQVRMSQKIAKISLKCSFPTNPLISTLKTMVIW